MSSRVIVTVRAIEYGPDVRRLVDAYAAQYQIENYLANPEQTWLGAFAGEELVGVAGFRDANDRRYINDWYVADGPIGVRAATALFANLRAPGVTLYGSVVAANKRMLAFFARRGANIQAYLLKLPPDAARRRR